MPVMLFFFLPSHKTCARDQNKAHATIEQRGMIHTLDICLRTKRSRSERRLVPQSKSRSCSLYKNLWEEEKRKKRLGQDRTKKKKRIIKKKVNFYFKNFPNIDNNFWHSPIEKNKQQCREKNKRTWESSCFLPQQLACERWVGGANQTEVAFLQFAGRNSRCGWQWSGRAFWWW